MKLADQRALEAQQLSHDEYQEPRLALREAVIRDGLNSFSGCHRDVSSASPPWCPPPPRLPPLRPPMRRLDPR